MRHFVRTLSLCLIASSAVLSGCNSDDETVAGDATVDLRLMETTDIHANVMDYNYYSDVPDPKIGLVRTATLIRQARAELSEPGNSVLVDNGDLIQGSPMGDWRQAEGLAPGEVHPVYKAMNQLDYTVANYGNHEFNYGLDYLAESVNDADFPYISANIFRDDGDDNPDNDEPYFSPYRLVDKAVQDREGNVHELTVGFIGFVPPQIMQWDKANLDGHVTTRDIKAMAERYVPQMKAEGADVVVAIAHSGISTKPYDPAAKTENSSWYLADVPGIDAIMMGHSHLVFPSGTFADTPDVDIDKGTIKGVPAVMPGYWGDHLGVIDLTLAYSADEDRWTVTDSQVEARPIMVDGQSVVEADGTITAAVASDHQATLDYMSTPIGSSTDDMFSFLALVKDDPSIQIVSDAQKAYVEDLIQGDVNLQDLPVLSAAAPFKACDRNGDCSEESSFTTVPQGQLTLRNAADLYLYPNTLVAVKVNGDELRGWLECSASQFYQIDPNSSAPQELVNYTGFPTYNFDVIDGVTYEIDVTQPPRDDRDCNVINDGAHRIQNLQYQGVAVTSDQAFIVATNNYRANGGVFPGTGSDHIVINSPDANRTVLANYIRNNSPVTPTADGNWSFATISSGTSVKPVFRVPNTNRALNFVADKAPNATFLEVNANNERVYELNLQ
ncbi:bifunctional 2',3'-cyclic-nucleotide 2'-phosphodiesterase/3'-nucleotidase [Marinobacter halodurans]|uniref:Bifunctional 2',3'-cyclic-nucleotide 2'-phosphodiesterase/3'-nucleotidase n=1 Tax=Marinobacter halodurans TaxID=2528979 RepID=A0ABY1ZMP1_9GAMM|nr:bifunctional 2',3'-cyclic-nucleotide 2'-phosphodiesterase/3'-nucleotidase [Marinobacter halodurans]TBW57599.1 bifunctional 2',3'-cyclic-nucleotide 2'-phosphodiesterase/3'-nucleotidase [Marinobacter halodurans]